MLIESLSQFFKAFEFAENYKLSMIFRVVFFRGLFFPILTELRILDRKAIAIVCENENVAKILSQAFSFLTNSSVFSINDLKGTWQRKLVENEGDVILFTYGKGPHSEENILLFDDFLQTGFLNEEPINALPIVCYRGVVPRTQRNSYFHIRIGRGEIVERKVHKLSDDAFKEIMDFAVEKQAVFEWEVRKFFTERNADSNTATEKALMASAVICKVFLAELYGLSKAEEELENMLDAIREYSQRNEEEQDSDGIGDAFIALLNKETNQNVRVYAKNAVDLDFCNSFRYVIYDDKFYFINEEFFEKICDPLLDTVGIGVIKNQLTDEEIIVPNQTAESFTVKVALCFPYGNVERKRLLRLNREKIDRPGIPDLTVKGEQNGGTDNRKIRGKRSACAIRQF